jgi:hypothetical protein
VRIALLILFTTSALAACSSEPTRCLNDRDTTLRPFAEEVYVAHAGGSPEGLQQGFPYTNSLEAFELSYANGFRSFEFDMVTLGDGTVLLAHDNHEPEYGLPGAFTDATRADLEGAMWGGEFTALFGEDLIDLMVEYPDVWIILDTKWDHVLIAETLVAMTNDTTILDRMVPHLTSAEHTTALESVYPFPERLLAVYQWRADEDQELLDRMEMFGLDDVMMWWNWRWTEELQVELDARGYNAWVHTPAESDLIHTFLDRGVGVYTNGYIGDCSDTE